MDAEENTKKQQTDSLPSQAPEILRGKHGAGLQNSVVGGVCRHRASRRGLRVEWFLKACQAQLKRLY